jgi:ADP-heptose:LPS heptosyltransferase
MTMVSRIAIFRALYLGDMLCIIPTVRAIRKAYPDSEIYLVGLPWQRDFVSRFSAYFDHLIEFPGWPGLPEQKFDAGRAIEFLQHIRAYKFDLVLQMQGNGVITNTLCMLWDGRKVCGLRREGEYCPNEELFPISKDGEHEVLRFLKLADALAIPRQGTELEFPITDFEMSTVRKMIGGCGLEPREYICVHPGARDVRRRWPIENFASIANEITAQGYPVMLTGSMEEKSLLCELQRQISGRVTNIVESFGHLTAGELGCVLQHSRLLVSNDTGVSHIASALRVPSTILFSAYSDMNRWRPLDAGKHLAIPYEKTTDIDYVLQCIMSKIEEQNTREAKSVSIV